MVRLHQVSYALKAHKETGRAVAADRLAGVAGFAPTTFHALGSRVAADRSRAAASTWWSPTCPGRSSRCTPPARRMTETYPVPPLLPGHALAIGVTSYDGGVYFGLNADRDALPDLDVLGQCVARGARRAGRQHLAESGSGRRAGARGRGRPREEAGDRDDLRVYVPTTLDGLRALVRPTASGRRRSSRTR